MNSLLILYSYIFSQDEKEIIRSIAVETGDTLVDSEDYLQPNTQAPSCSNIGIPISDSPLPQVRQTWDRDTLRFTMELRPSARLCSLKGTFFCVFFLNFFWQEIFALLLTVEQWRTLTNICGRGVKSEYSSLFPSPREQDCRSKILS